MAKETYLTREFFGIKGIDAAADGTYTELDRAAAANDLYPKDGHLRTRPSLVHAGEFRRPVAEAKGAFGIYSVGSRVLIRLGAYMLEWLCFPNVRQINSGTGGLISDENYKVLTSSLSSRTSERAPISADAVVKFGDALFVYNENGVFKFGESGTEIYTPTAALSRMNAVDSVSKFSSIADRDAPFLSKKGKYAGRKNMLSPCFRISVAADGESRTFALGKSGSKAISCVYVFGGKEKFRALSDAAASSVTLPDIPDRNSEITVLCYDPIAAGAVCEPLSKAFGTVFDGRVFLCAAADKNANGRVIYSADADPFFFPENAVCRGSEETEALAQVGKRLAAVERAGTAAPLIRFYSPHSVSDDSVGREYPSEYGIYGCGVDGVGNIAEHLGSPLFVSEDGVKRITAATANGTAALTNSSRGINSLLRKSGIIPRLSEANGTAFLSVGTDLYVSFSEDKNARTREKENGWFRWTGISSPSGEAPFLVSFAGTEKSGRLTVFSETADKNISVEFLDSDAGRDYSGTENERLTEPVLITAATDFSDRTRLKRLSKRGCSLCADGDVELFVVPNTESENRGIAAAVESGRFSDAEKYKVNLYGRQGRFAFRPTAEAANEFGAVIVGRGRIDIGTLVLSARKTKSVGGKR